MSSRSVRSASPTSQRSPRPSARAFAYDTSKPATRQNSATPASSLLCPPSTNQAASPANTDASATRSRVESRNAPKMPVVPLTRARAPSSMSAITKNQQTIVPANRWPVGYSASAPADIPTVPVIVRALGVIGVRASAPATGSSSRVRNGRSALSMAV